MIDGGPPCKRPKLNVASSPRTTNDISAGMSIGGEWHSPKLEIQISQYYLAIGMIYVALTQM